MPLVGYWPLVENSGGTAYDHSGNGNDGTVNGATQGAPGILGQTAYSFDGVDDNLTMGNVLSGLDPLTASFWWNPGNDLSGGVENNWIFFGRPTEWRIENRDDTTDGSRLAMGLWGDRFSTSQSTWLAGTWYHVVVVVDSGAGRYEWYVDGSLDASASSSTSVTADSTGIFHVGYDDGTSSDYLNADLGEIRVYDHALTESEIHYLYSESQQQTATSEWKGL